MSSFEDTIWAHLVEHCDADRVRAKQPAASVRQRKFAGRPHAPRFALATGTTGIAAAVAAALVVGVGSSAPPAYALTQDSDGSVTVTINDVATGVPALNAAFAKLGIRAVAIPVTANCTASNSSVPLIDLGDADMAQSETVSNAQIPSGETAFLAADQTSPGHVELAVGTTSQALPACLPADATPGTSYPAN